VGAVPAALGALATRTTAAGPTLAAAEPRRSCNAFRSINKKTLDLLQSYQWPGNIRELQNVIERSVILSSGEVFTVDEFMAIQGVFSTGISG